MNYLLKKSRCGPEGGMSKHGSENEIIMCPVSVTGKTAMAILDSIQ